MRLRCLGRVCEEYRRETGSPAYLVGGAAVALWTGGAFHSADFDLIVAAEERFHEILLQHGFCPEDRAGKLRVGYYHPDYHSFGWQLVTGPMFDGRADRIRVAQFQINAGSAVVLPAIEDLIADRLGQYAGGNAAGCITPDTRHGFSSRWRTGSIPPIRLFEEAAR